MIIPGYIIVKVGEINILCIGGQYQMIEKPENFLNKKEIEDLMEKEKINEEEISKKIDRTYLPDEIPFYDEKILDKIISKNTQITQAITNTLPYFCFRKGLDKIKMLLLSEPPLGKDIYESRKVLTDIYNYLLKKGQKIKTWTYGHFHESNKEIINEITFTYLINADNFSEYISFRY